MHSDIFVCLADSSLRIEWDTYIEKNELSIAWQRWEWHEILSRHYEHDFFPVVALKADKICGLMPLYRLAGSRQFISVPYAVAGGIISDSIDIEIALSTYAIQLAQQQKVDSIVLKQYKHKVEGDFRVDNSYFNQELAISTDIELLWNNLDHINREMIKNAQNLNLILDYPSDDIKSFYKLLLKYQHHQGIPCVHYEWIEDLVKSSMYTCALVKYKGSVVAGTLVKSFKKTVSFPFTSTIRANDLCDEASYWLYWELIKYFSQKGYEIMHSGRIPANEDVPKFRLGWGGKKYTYYYQYYPNISFGRTEFSQKRGHKRKLFTTLWRILPIPIVAKIGPRIVKKFP